MRSYPFKLCLVNGNMSGSLTTVPNSIQMTNQWGGAISCVVTNGSSAVGTLALQGSADNINFVTLVSNGTPITLSVAGNGTYLFDVTVTSCQDLQVVYTPVSGTGTLNITTFMKGY